MRVFVSYRRGDSADVTGRIRDRLARQFGPDAVFLDVDSIPLGADFRRYLADAVRKSDVVLVIIGAGWVQAIDEAGRSRLENRDDFVRLEVESALSSGVPVVPVLVGGATMPREEELPASIAGLAFRQGTAVRGDPDFHTDMDRVIRALRAEAKANRPGRALKWLIPAGIAIFALLVLLVVRLFDTGSGSVDIGSASDTTTSGTPDTTTGPSVSDTATVATSPATAPATTAGPATEPTSGSGNGAGAGTGAPPVTPAPQTVPVASTAMCPPPSEFRRAAGASSEFAMEEVPPDGMYVVLQMKIQGSIDQQFISICLDQARSAYWYFSRGLTNTTSGVATPAAPLGDGFEAVYPGAESPIYRVDSQGVTVVRPGEADLPRPIIPPALCIDHGALPPSSFTGISDAPVCSTQNAARWDF